MIEGMRPADKPIIIKPSVRVLRFPNRTTGAEPLRADANIEGNVEKVVNRDICPWVAPRFFAARGVKPYTVAKVMICNNTANPEAIKSWGPCQRPEVPTI